MEKVHLPRFPFSWYAVTPEIPQNSGSNPSGQKTPSHQAAPAQAVSPYQSAGTAPPPAGTPSPVGCDGATGKRGCPDAAVLSAPYLGSCLVSASSSIAAAPDRKRGCKAGTSTRGELGDDFAHPWALPAPGHQSRAPAVYLLRVGTAHSLYLVS